MDNPNSTALPTLCFAQVYERNIEANIKEIDIFLKTTAPPYSIDDISNLLHIDASDLIYILEQHKITTLNMLSFFTIVQTSSSYICKLIQREWKYHHIKHYTPEMIAYIYDLNLDKVSLAFEESGLPYVEPNNIKELFKHIYVPVMNL